MTEKIESRDESSRMFINCEKCGKRLIERLPNGLFKFIFGRNKETNRRPPVQMLIHGSIKILCLRTSCNHINTLDYFPWMTKKTSDKDISYKEFIFNTIEPTESNQK